MPADAISNNMSGFDVAVIIPSYRSSRTLEQCLQAITNQKTRYRYQVTIVHTGPEPIPEHVYLRFNTVIFHIFKERWLPGKARNWAINHTQTAWILFLDADCLVREDWVETMVSSVAQQDISGAGGSVRNATWWSLIAWTMHILEFGEWLPGTEWRYCHNFPSCNAVYRRSALLQAGGFPEDIFPCEDTVLNHVLCQGGHKLAFFPECIVDHIHHKTIITLLKHNYLHGLTYGQSCYLYRLPGQFLIRLNMPLVILVSPIRFFRISIRLIPDHLLELFLFVISAPLVLLSLIAWGGGFAFARYRYRNSALGSLAISPSNISPEKDL